MTKEFGKGFTVTNLKNMRQFYLIFQKLAWTHYRLLMRVENEIDKIVYNLYRLIVKKVD
jgi:probable cytoplasmic protein